MGGDDADVQIWMALKDAQAAQWGTLNPAQLTQTHYRSAAAKLRTIDAFQHKSAHANGHALSACVTTSLDLQPDQTLPVAPPAFQTEMKAFGRCLLYLLCCSQSYLDQLD